MTLRTAVDKKISAQGPLTCSGFQPYYMVLNQANIQSQHGQDAQGMLRKVVSIATYDSMTTTADEDFVLRFKTKQ